MGRHKERCIKVLSDTSELQMMAITYPIQNCYVTPRAGGRCTADEKWDANVKYWRNSSHGLPCIFTPLLHAGKRYDINLACFSFKYTALGTL